MKTPKIHYAGAVRTPRMKILPGWAACCSGNRAERIRDAGNNTFDPSLVTCAACKRVMASARKGGEIVTPELSKLDAESLGVADMTGPQLRMRVLQVEGLMSELALVVEEMLQRFAPDNDGITGAQFDTAVRAREALATVRERYFIPPLTGEEHEQGHNRDEFCKLGIACKMKRGG